MYRFNTLVIQSWTLYVISISLIFSRLISRRLTLGQLKRFQADDWLMLVASVPYTTSIVLANQIGNASTPQERIFRYVLEEMQIITTWLVKACLLVLYWRIFPVQTGMAKRRALQAVATFCCISFLIVQASLLLWCRPTENSWKITTTNSQCTSYHAHSALTLSFTIPTTLTTMLLPVPFISTPRRLLLAILLLLGTLVLIASIVSRSLILTAVGHQDTQEVNTNPAYLSWFTTESTLSIIFANLPFLTSLVVTAAPARMRHFSLAQWPRSRRASVSWSDNGGGSASVRPELRTMRFDSTATTIAELTFIGNSEKREERESRIAGVNPDGVERHGGRTLSGHGDSVSRDEEVDLDLDLELPCPSMTRPETRDSQVPKMRLSGGLAEMGELSLQDTRQGWPTYWR